MNFGFGDLPKIEADTLADDHPAILADNGTSNPVAITCCANCGQLRTVLWLVNERWYCTQCKASGANRPTVFAIN